MSFANRSTAERFHEIGEEQFRDDSDPDVEGDDSGIFDTIAVSRTVGGMPEGFQVDNHRPALGFRSFVYITSRGERVRITTNGNAYVVAGNSKYQINLQDLDDELEVLRACAKEMKMSVDKYVMLHGERKGMKSN